MVSSGPSSTTYSYPCHNLWRRQVRICTGCGALTGMRRERWPWVCTFGTDATFERRSSRRVSGRESRGVPGRSSRTARLHPLWLQPRVPRAKQPPPPRSGLRCVMLSASECLRVPLSADYCCDRLARASGDRVQAEPSQGFGRRLEQLSRRCPARVGRVADPEHEQCHRAHAHVVLFRDGRGALGPPRDLLPLRHEP